MKTTKKTFCLSELDDQSFKRSLREAGVMLAKVDAPSDLPKTASESVKAAASALKRFDDLEGLRKIGFEGLSAAADAKLPVCDISCVGGLASELAEVVRTGGLLADSVRGGLLEDKRVETSRILAVGAVKARDRMELPEGLSARGSGLDGFLGMAQIQDARIEEMRAALQRTDEVTNERDRLTAKQYFGMNPFDRNFFQPNDPISGAEYFRNESPAFNPQFSQRGTAQKIPEKPRAGGPHSSDDRALIRKAKAWLEEAYELTGGASRRKKTDMLLSLPKKFPGLTKGMADKAWKTAEIKDWKAKGRRAND